MQSRLADDLAAEEAARIRAMTPSQRMELALRLGAEAERAYAALHGISRREARTRMDAIAQIGRRPNAWER